MTVSAQDSLGRLGLPAPISELASRTWDAVVVGGGHNGLTAAAYLARAGKAVLVLERREQVGGACTLDQPFDDPKWLVSPCAYLVGLLHPTVVEELGLARYGYRVQIADPHLWCPFEDGSSLALWDDDDRSATAIAAVSPNDVDGYRRYSDVFARIRRALRSSNPEQDTWLGPSPTTGEIVERLGSDQEAVEVITGASIMDIIDRYITSDRLKIALHGQGSIGTFAGPRDPGTAAVHAMHSLGTINGVGGAWGYVEGGMGRISFALADVARDLGAVIASGVEVASIEPGWGVVLNSGERVEARVVISNADPVRTLALVDGEAVPTALKARVSNWKIESPTIKLNCGLSRFPKFTANSDGTTPYKAMVTIATRVDDTQAACDAARRGVPSPKWCELYFHTAYDRSIAPEGKQTMSVFGQFVPYELAEGSWATRRNEIAKSLLDHIAQFAPDVHDCVEELEVLAPPDVEERVGLTGGHIFQGECLPDQMWDKRFAPKLPIEGVYLCGAATHPGGSVIAANGRNAAMAVLAESF